MQIIEWDGEPITRPGIYSGVDIDSYHRGLVAEFDPETGEPWYSVSRSQLWTLFNESPAHCWDKSPYNPDRDPDVDESAPLLFGRAAHHLLLGEEKFGQSFVIRPTVYPEGVGYDQEWTDDMPVKPWSGNAKWCKAWLKEAKDSKLGVITEDQIKNIQGMARGLNADPMVRNGILNGYVEHTIVVRDPETGIWIKVRPDNIPNDSGDLADLKTAADVGDSAVEESIGRDGLFMQGGMTAWACRLLPEPIEVQSFNLVLSEKTRPFCARVRALKPNEMELGEAAARIATKIFAKCMERGVWPGPGGEQTDAAYIEMKPYHRKRIEDRMKLMESEL